MVTKEGGRAGDTCSAKLKVPADLPFTGKGTQPLLCTAHSIKQEPAVSISQVPSGRREVLPSSESLHPAELLKTPKSFGLCGCSLSRLTVLATETQECVHLYSFKNNRSKSTVFQHIFINVNDTFLKFLKNEKNGTV